MNFEQKLDVVIKEIATVYNLNEGQAKLLKNNIISRNQMYRNIKPNFNSDETKIILNSDSIGDFFINRLVNNIREYDFSQVYNKDNTDKGTYTSKKQSVYVGNFKFIEDITRDKFNQRMSNFDNDTLYKATINVFNHEIGHALQTSFRGRYGNDDRKYNQLIHNLVTKYPNEFKLQAIDDNLNPIHQGMIPKNKNDAKAQARSFYFKVSFTTHLDEIFNEDESLKVTGVSKIQFKYDMGNGFYKDIYNYQSSNYKITSYAKMMKIIMGETKTFQSMYEDSIIAYEFFDQFKGISDNVFKGSTYQGKAPMLNVLNSLEQVRNHSSLAEAQKLDLFLTECLKKKVLHELSNPNLSQNDLDIVKGYINDFVSQMVRNPKVVTEQDMIILNLKKIVNEREKQLTNLNDINSNNLMDNIISLKKEVMQVYNEYKQMMSDGEIDVNELKILMNRLTILRNNVNGIEFEKLTNREQKILYQINSIILSGLQKMNDICLMHEKDKNGNKNLK